MVLGLGRLPELSNFDQKVLFCELTGYNIEKVTKDKLYEISKKLYEEKSGLENHLSRCTNDLFKLEDKSS